MMRQELEQRINICFEGLLATLRGQPARNNGDTYHPEYRGLKDSRTSSLAHLSPEYATPLREQVIHSA